MTRRIELLGLISALAACSAADGPPATSVQDSAGVSVVNNHSTDAWPVLHLSEIPVFEVGAGTDPDPPLFRVTAVAPLSDGGVAVGMTSPPQVFVFDQDGRSIAKAGGPGEGPGEFSYVGSVVALPRDSLAVWDPYRRRVSVFSREGELGREADLSHVAPMSAGGAGSTEYNSGYTHLMASDTDALLLHGEGAISAGDETGVTRPSLPSHRLSLDGALLGTYGAFPGMEVVQPGGFPMPLGKRTYAVSVDDALVISSSESTEYRVLGPTGDLRQIVRWPDQDRSVAGEFLQRWAGFLEDQPELAAMVEQLPRPDQFPALGDMIKGQDGTVWVSEYPGPVGIFPIRRGDDAPDMLRPVARVSARQWFGFDREGAVVGKFVTPEGFEPYEVSAGLIWGVFTDESDVESVRAYRLRISDAS